MDHNYLALAVPTLLFALAAHKFKDVDLPDIIKEYFYRVCPMCVEKEKENVELDEIKEQLIELTETIQDYVLRNPDIFSKEE
tara:strand:- start:5853 stop:6098 length:246 start_codon:yes stop_codon:yes gene_type:complete